MMSPRRTLLAATALFVLAGCASQTRAPTASAASAAEHAGHHPDGAAAPETTKPDPKMGGDMKGGMMGGGMMGGKSGGMMDSDKSGKMGGGMMGPKGQADADKDKMAMKCDPAAMKDAKGDCPMMKK